MKTSDNYGKLSTINALFSAASGSDSYQTEQISAALRYAQTREREPESVLSAEPFDQEVKDLIELHLNNRSQSHGVAVWDMRHREYDPLWIRYHIVSELRKIAGYPEATLIIVGLREAICPKGKYFTDSKKTRYQQAVEYVEELALKFTTSRTKLNLLFV